MITTLDFQALALFLSFARRLSVWRNLNNSRGEINTGGSFRVPRRGPL